MEEIQDQGAPGPQASPLVPAQATPLPPVGADCPTCGGAASATFVYALGKIEPRFPRLPSTLGGIRRVVEVVFSFTDRRTDVTDKHFVRVDVTEQFPFLVTKLSPYFDR